MKTLNGMDSWLGRCGSLLAILLFGFVAKADLNCDPALKPLKTTHLQGVSLCELQVRYQNAIAELQSNGIKEPQHIGNAFAPRFINMSTWRSYLTKNGDSEFAAWSVYSPAPKTWLGWARVARMIDRPESGSVFINGTNEQILSWLLNLHRIAMTGLLYTKAVGTFRKDVAEIIPLHYLNNAYSLDQIQRVSNTPFTSFRTKKKLMNYDQRICENQTSRADNSYPVMIFRKDPSNLAEPLKSCGDLTMAPADEVLEQMQNWAAYIQTNLKLALSGSNQVDIIELASRAQQWMVVVHPFIDGNGRMSRFMMDLVLRQLNLPPPNLDDMNQDFFATSSEWADLVGKGMLNTVQALEACVQDPQQLGCQVVANEPRQSTAR